MWWGCKFELRLAHKLHQRVQLVPLQAMCKATYSSWEIELSGSWRGVTIALMVGWTVCYNEVARQNSTQVQTRKINTKTTRKTYTKTCTSDSNYMRSTERKHPKTGTIRPLLTESFWAGEKSVYRGQGLKMICFWSKRKSERAVEFL